MESLNNISENDKKNYLLCCVKILFPNFIKFWESKRLNNEEDKQKMISIKKDLFNDKIKVIDTLKKYGLKFIYNMKKLKTINNLSFFNYVSDKVNKYVIENLVDVPKKNIIFSKNKYWKDMTLICKKHFRNNKVSLYVNYEYVIKNINDEKFTIHECVEDVNYVLDINMLNHFKYPYCSTVHSVQGLTIENEYTLFDCDSAYVNRNWIYTALTRTDDMNKITIFKCSDKQEDFSKRLKIKAFFEDKCQNMKKQDKKAGRDYDDKKYVNADWINEQFGIKQSCSACNIPYEIFCENGFVKSNISVDRINCSLAHHKDNCRMMCV